MMKRRAKLRDISAFTLVEMMTGAVVASFIGVAIFSMTNTAMMMTARNLSENLTGNHERKSLDRIEQAIQQAYTMPVLINTTGASATSPAPGASFDYFVGSPYVLTVSGSSLPASTTSLTLVRSTNSVVVAPVPSVNDVVMINGAASTVRALISSVAAGSSGSTQQTITVTLASQLGSIISVPTSGVLTAVLVHKVAFIVMPAGSGYELRYYPNYETTTNLNTPSQYILLSDQIGLSTPDPTPFTLNQIESTNFVTLSLRVRSNVFDQRLNKKQGDQFNTYARLDVYIRPKINPQ
jgi:hypothetical protein